MMRKTEVSPPENESSQGTTRGRAAKQKQRRKLPTKRHEPKQPDAKSLKWKKLRKNYTTKELRIKHWHDSIQRANDVSKNAQRVIAAPIGTEVSRRPRVVSAQAHAPRPIDKLQIHFAFDKPRTDTATVLTETLVDDSTHNSSAPCIDGENSLFQAEHITENSIDLEAYQSATTKQSLPSGSESKMSQIPKLQRLVKPASSLVSLSDGFLPDARTSERIKSTKENFNILKLLKETREYDVMCFPPEYEACETAFTGNYHLRKLCREDFLALYMMERNNVKPCIPGKIASYIMNMGGRFLKQINGALCQIGAGDAELKVKEELDKLVLKVFEQQREKLLMEMKQKIINGTVGDVNSRMI